MTYRFRLASNLRPLVLPVAVVALIAGSIAIIAFYHVVLGIVALAVVGFVGYHVVKFFVNTIRSHVTTTEDELICLTSLGREMKIRWDAVSHAGSYTDARGRRDLFVYAEADDRLLSIPEQYEMLDELEAEILEKSGVEPSQLSGEDPEDLTDELRAIVAPEGEIIDDEE